MLMDEESREYFEDLPIGAIFVAWPTGTTKLIKISSNRYCPNAVRLQGEHAGIPQELGLRGSVMQVTLQYGEEVVLESSES